MNPCVNRALKVLFSLTLVISLVPTAAFADATTDEAVQENQAGETRNIDSATLERGTGSAEVDTSSSGKSNASTAVQSAQLEEGAAADPEENSWRYSDGELIDASEYSANPKARSANRAWSKTPDGWINGDGEVISGAKYKGIDVSHHNGTINWQKVKDDGVDFAIIRCGYVGQDTGVKKTDEKWEYNVSECERLGIPYGVYIYSYASTVSRASQEADHVINLLKGHNPSYPVYFDLEEKSLESTSNRTLLANMATTFCNKIAAAGYTPGVYANLNWWNNYLTNSCFDNWDRWVARYNDSITSSGYSKTHSLWQCTSTGRVDGISGDVDINFDFNGRYYSGSKPEDAQVAYQTHVQGIGWQGWAADGSQSGTTGSSKRLEAIKIELNDDIDGSVQYRTHVQTYGWESGWKSDGAVSGTSGQSKRLEAIQIRLTGDVASRYDVYYRVHAQKFGWLGWAKNGASAGTAGYSYRLEAIQIELVPKGSAAPGSTSGAFKQAGIKYSTHVQTTGWQTAVFDGKVSGTTGKSKRLEGIKINLGSFGYSGSVQYRTHVQTYGWESGWKSDGAVSGTSGQSKRLEAIQIRLTGDVASRYDVYYRVHAQKFGWLGWAKNGASAGTAGYSYRLEAIQIELVPKGSAAPGSTSGAFKQR